MFSFIDSYNNFIMVGDGHIPAFIYKNKRPLFFDPGVSAFGPFYAKKINEILVERDVPLTVLLTHSHFDHCGAVPYLLRKFPQIKVGASMRAAEVLKKPAAIEFISSFNAEYEQKMSRELQGEDTSFQGIHVDRTLKGGDTIELGDGEV